MSELTIRQAIPEDVPQIEEMYRRRVTYNDAQGIHQWDLEEVTWTALSQLYEVSDYYVGMLDNQVVCGLFIVDIDELYWPDTPKGETLFLHKICVDPAFSGRGFADAMISFFKEKGRREGYPYVCLDVREHKEKLRAMYERNGFLLYKIGQFKPEFTTALYRYTFHEETAEKI